MTHVFRNSKTAEGAAAHTDSFQQDVRARPRSRRQSRPVDEPVTSFWGIVMPLSNLDLKRLPEGSYTYNSQKLYTDDPVEIKPGQIILDTYDGQKYTVTQELSHNSIHPMVRYIVEGVKK